MGFEDFSQETEEHYYDGEPHSFNRVWIGFILSILLPIAIFAITLYFSGQYALFSNMQEFTTFLLKDDTGRMTNLFVISLMPSMFAFFFIYKSERWKLSRGFIFGTLLCMAVFFMRSVL